MAEKSNAEFVKQGKEYKHQLSTSRYGRVQKWIGNACDRLEQQQEMIRKLKTAYESSDIPKCSRCDSLHRADKRKLVLITKAEEMLKPGE